MNILLIRPPYDLKSISPNFPIGLAYLAASLRERGHRPEILDLPLQADPGRALERRLQERVFPLIGISALTVQYPGARQVAEAIRRFSPHSRIVLGGPHPSVLPSEALAETGASFAVIGEGERSLTELAGCLQYGIDWRGIPSLAYLEQGRLVRNPAWTQPLPPDDIPLPAYDLLDLEPYFGLHFSEYVRPGSRPMQIFTSRGCPYQCTFCHELFGKRFRACSPGRVLKEIRLLHGRYEVDEFLIYDDIFNLDLDRAKQIFRLVVDSGMRVGFSFPNGMRAERMDAELMDLMSQAGVHTVTVAVESASERMQKVIKKRLKLPKVAEFLALARGRGMRTQAFFIIGFPGETLAEIEQTIRFARSLKDLDYAFFSFATPYPGTELARQAEALGLPVALHGDALDFYVPHVQTPEFSYRRLKWLRLKASLLFYGTPRRLWNLLGELRHPLFSTLYLSSLGRFLELWRWRPEGLGGYHEGHEGHEAGGYEGHEGVFRGMPGGAGGLGR